MIKVKGGKIGLVIGSILSLIVFAINLNWFNSLPLEGEQKIWLPSNYKVEEALSVNLSGTAVFKSFSEYRERFADTEALLILESAMTPFPLRESRNLYYLAKGEELTYVTMIRTVVKSTTWKTLVDTEIEGAAIKTKYARDWFNFFLVFIFCIPILSVILGFYFGSLIAEYCEKNPETLPATTEST